MTQGYRQVGKARVSESRMRWFESSYPCHMKIRHRESGAFLYTDCSLTVSSSLPLTKGKVGAKRSDEVYASVWNPANTQRGVHGVVLFLFPLNGPYAQFYGPSYLLPSPGRGVHIGV